MFRKVLIANRGEIACRVARTCARLGIAAATVHTPADRDALHVREIGESVALHGAKPGDGYRDIAAIVAAALRSGATAVHPGIGFLAEDPAFAAAVEAAGLVFIGPTPDTLARLGDKWAAKQEAAAARIPTLGGSAAATEPGEVARAAREIGMPVVLKAAAGGGGRGITVVETDTALAGEIAAAMRIAQASFGRPDLLVERFIDRARHVEVQIAGDGRGGAIHLYERECSLQRRHQKIIEEAPAPGLDPVVRASLLAAAVHLAARLGYRGLGTIEFLISGDRFYFLEANPRLQVEHPVTECVTGIDLVELQLRIAAGATLPLTQEAVVCTGHAVEARICAEDPAAGFVPVTGVLHEAAFASAGVRVDTGVDRGSVVTPWYDSMIAKMIAHEAERGVAIERLAAALHRSRVLGVVTNMAFLEALLGCEAVRAGAVDTRFVDREFGDWRPGNAPHALTTVGIAGAVWLISGRSPDLADPWTSRALTRWRHGDGTDQVAGKPACYIHAGDKAHPVAFSPFGADGRLTVGIGAERMVLRIEDLGTGRYRVTLDGMVNMITAVVEPGGVHLHGPFGTAAFGIEPYLTHAGEGREASGRLRAPMMGQIIRISTRVGDAVRAGEVVLVQESMKMEFRVVAPFDGVVVELAAREGEMVARNSFVAEISPHDARGAPGK